MRYCEINEHLKVETATGSWLSMIPDNFFETADLVREFDEYRIMKRDNHIGLLKNGKVMGYASVVTHRHQNQMNKMEVDPTIRGKGVSVKFYEGILDYYGILITDTVMTAAAISFTKKMMTRHPSGILDAMTGKIYQLTAVGQIIPELGIKILSPEEDNGSSDRNAANRPVERNPEDYRFFWIISKSPLNFEVLS